MDPNHIGISLLETAEKVSGRNYDKRGENINLQNNKPLNRGTFFSVSVIERNCKQTYYLEELFLQTLNLLPKSG